MSGRAISRFQIKKKMDRYEKFEAAHLKLDPVFSMAVPFSFSYVQYLCFLCYGIVLSPAQLFNGKILF
jgi:hypothetical protein